MRKLFVVLSLLVVASLALAACGPTAAPQVIVVTATPNGEAMMGTVEAFFTQTAMAKTPAPNTIMPTTTPTATLTATPVPAFRVPNAEAMRAFGHVNGWVTGEGGKFVQGAQIVLKNDFDLRTMDETYVLEIQCVHYSVKNGKVIAKPVCDDGKVLYDTAHPVVLKGTVGTLWTSHVVAGSKAETWPEGFLDKPCVCADGDCRDE